MKYILDSINAKEYIGDIVFLYGDEGAERLLPLSRKELNVVKQRREKDKNFIEVFDRLPHHIYLVSFNSETKASECQEGLRRQAQEVLAMLKPRAIEQLAITGANVLPEEVVAFVEGITLADYSFDRYIVRKTPHLQQLIISDFFLNQDDIDNMERLMNRIYWCREWVNMPPADLTATRFADELQAVAASLPDVSCTVMDRKQIESLRMGGLLAVNRGSAEEPRFVVIEYHPAGSPDAPIALVGKGVMYDTGGLNIKPEDYMCEMKSDMAGAATMASVLFAAADNRLPVHLVALLPLTDNQPSPKAYAADDVLTMYDGTTVEIVNTDAEGRLILADAIAYAARNYKPSIIIDAATLTGAAVRTFSTFGIAAMQQDADPSMTMLKIAGEQVYERIAELPMWQEYDELIKGSISDLRNCGSTPQAGTITAGKFLAHFAGTTPFIHLDIAGVAFFSKPQHYYAAGASGYGVRLLYAFLQLQGIMSTKNK